MQSWTAVNKFNEFRFIRAFFLVVCDAKGRSSVNAGGQG